MDIVLSAVLLSLLYFTLTVELNQTSLLVAHNLEKEGYSDLVLSVWVFRGMIRDLYAQK